MSQGHTSEFVDSTSWLSSGLPSQAFAAYGSAQDRGGTPLRPYGSNDPYTNLFSHQASHSLAHDGS